jgi:hypothetical protein
MTCSTARTNHHETYYLPGVSNSVLVSPFWPFYLLRKWARSHLLTLELVANRSMYRSKVSNPAPPVPPSPQCHPHLSSYTFLSSPPRFASNTAALHNGRRSTLSLIHFPIDLPDSLHPEHTPPTFSPSYTRATPTYPLLLLLHLTPL